MRTVVGNLFCGAEAGTDRDQLGRGGWWGSRMKEEGDEESRVLDEQFQMASPPTLSLKDGAWTLLASIWTSSPSVQCSQRDWLLHIQDFLWKVC